MVAIPVGFPGMLQYPPSAARHGPVAIPGAAASSLDPAVAAQLEEREEFQGGISSCDRAYRGQGGASASSGWRQFLQHTELKFSGECKIQDFRGLAGVRGWRKAGGKSTARRLALRAVGARAQHPQAEQSGELAGDGRTGPIFADSSDDAEMESDFDISRLEAYTERVQWEVLCVHAVVDDEEDQVIIFKGFSSSLMRATPNDQTEPVLPSNSLIVGIDRMRGPYRPSAPEYIQRGVSWRDFKKFLQEHGM